MSTPPRGAPKGNRNAAMGSAWRNALKAKLEKYAKEGVLPGTALERIAEKVVELALEGDRDAYREIGDRLDGKPAQSIHMEHSVTELPDEHVESRIAELLGKAGAAVAASGEGETIQ